MAETKEIKQAAQTAEPAGETGFITETDRNTL